MDTALDLLSQFTGTGGGAKHALVNFGVAAIFWTLLLTIARLSPDRDSNRLTGLLIAGTTIALSRELLMLGVKVTEAYGLMSPEKLHLVFPPLEHALSNVGLTMVAAVFAGRICQDPARWLAFARRWVGVLGVVYVTTAVWWAQFSWRNPTTRFGQTWTDWAFRITTSLILAIVVVAILRASTAPRARITALAFVMLFANEFLKIIDMAQGERYEATFATVRHGLFLLALPLLAYVYIREQSEQLSELLHSLERRVSERTEELEIANAELTTLSITDSLTGVGNRAALEHELRSEWVRSQRDHTPLSVVLFDLDHFKAINDGLGHLGGDRALADIASCLKGHLRDNYDFVGRYGGDEFVMLLPNTEAEQAKIMAERIRSQVASVGEVTLSIGIATAIAAVGDNSEDLLASADEALYAAKEAGRNGVVEHAGASLHSGMHSG